MNPANATEDGDLFAKHMGEFGDCPWRENFGKEWLRVQERNRAAEMAVTISGKAAPTSLMTKASREKEELARKRPDSSAPPRSLSPEEGKGSRKGNPHKDDPGRGRGSRDGSDRRDEITRRNTSRGHETKRSRTSSSDRDRDQRPESWKRRREERSPPKSRKDLPSKRRSPSPHDRYTERRSRSRDEPSRPYRSGGKEEASPSRRGTDTGTTKNHEDRYSPRRPRSPSDHRSKQGRRSRDESPRTSTSRGKARTSPVRRKTPEEKGSERDTRTSLAPKKSSSGKEEERHLPATTKDTTNTTEGRGGINANDARKAAEELAEELANHDKEVSIRILLLLGRYKGSLLLTDLTALVKETGTPTRRDRTMSILRDLRLRGLVRLLKAAPDDVRYNATWWSTRRVAPST
jgi:hypothetical protein